MVKRIASILAGPALIFAAWMSGIITFDKAQRAPEVKTAWVKTHTSFAITGCTIPNGNERGWLWVSRDDNGDVTKGLPIEFTKLSSGENEPIISRESDGWHVRFIPKPTPTP